MTPHERLQRAKDLLAKGRPSTTTFWPHWLLQLALNEGAPPEACVSRGEMAKAALDLGLPCARTPDGTRWVGLDGLRGHVPADLEPVRVGTGIDGVTRALEGAAGDLLASYDRRNEDLGTR
jgi:hypothetical protein